MATRAHIDRHYDEELRDLRSHLLEMGGLVEKQIADAIRALVERDDEFARLIIERDRTVNRMEVQIDDLCLRLLALHQPAARDLRLITTALKITTDLERAGDMAENICERVLELCREPQLKPLIDLPRMAAIAQGMLRQSLDAFVREDAELALQVCHQDDEVDGLADQLLRELLTFMLEDPHTISRALRLIFISKYLERLADHATNIAEMVIFMVKGEEHPAHGPATLDVVTDAAKKKILVVEDEPDIRELVRYNLEQSGFRVAEANDGEEALRMVGEEKPALVILDLMLPQGDGLEVCRALRGQRETADLPIVMLTAKAAEVDRVLGLEFGADDYVTKPFSPRELVARVRAVLRRAESTEAAPLTNVFDRGRLRIDFDRHEAWLDGRPLELSLREFQLLRFFVRNPNRVYDRLTILDLVWGNDTYVEPRTVDVHVRRLRLLVERDASNPELIQTVRGVGYRFNEQGLGA